MGVSTSKTHGVFNLVSYGTGGSWGLCLWHQISHPVGFPFIVLKLKSWNKQELVYVLLIFE